eukprot:TRINITY_DN1429_c0_g1_i2.p1 TRINITY_DN1429_c0_g1~~TRINITY_DN1429_c0_g1_i2.p1  ORF type:complete len:213 (+),score=47.63 TRINITY_DN1429_c0_g1_i2:15-653(+)
MRSGLRHSLFLRPSRDHQTRWLSNVNLRSINEHSQVEPPSDPDSKDPNELLFYALKANSFVTLKEMMQFGQSKQKSTKIMAAQFLHHEIPIRLAQRVRDLKRLPHGLAEMPSIRSVRELYEQSFWRFRQFPFPRTSQHEEEFTQMITDIKNKHAHVQQSIAMGINELTDKKGRNSQENEKLDFGPFLDKFFSTRISIRMLLGQVTLSSWNSS